MSWKDESFAWIKQQEYENPKMDREALRKHCSKNYPYYERRGFAYKAFLQAMREFFGDKTKMKKATALGQDDLFSPPHI